MPAPTTTSWLAGSWPITAASLVLRCGRAGPAEGRRDGAGGGSRSPPRRGGMGGPGVAGSVVAVGSRVERFRPGDAVFGDMSSFGFGGFGAFAEYVCAAELRLLTHSARMRW